MAGIVKKGNASSYQVTVDGEYARIFLEQGKSPSGYHWGQISVVSSFGNFGYGFGNIGPRSFEEFLLSVSFDYFMGKCLGTALYRFDPEETIKSIETFVTEQLEEGAIDETGAESVRTAIKEIDPDLSTSVECFMLELSWLCPEEFTSMELWGLSRTRSDLQAVGFWETIWPVFCAELRRKMKVAA